MNFEKLWNDLKKTMDDMISGELPIGNAGELSQLVNLRRIMDGMEELEEKDWRKFIRDEERENALNELAECYELFGNYAHMKGDKKRSEIFFGVMVLLKQQKFDPSVIGKEIHDTRKALAKLGYIMGADKNEKLT